MYELDQKYIDSLEEIASEIQKSEILEKYLEEEEESYFNELKDQFEPRMAEVYKEVADNDPLQLLSLEQVCMDEAFEGLFLPKILGYSVLRGTIDDNFKYLRPQDHFQEVLTAICNSANFDIIKNRIGQTVQIGFALSSDIWITNLINDIPNKKVRFYLQAQKLDVYRDPRERKKGYLKYKSQFDNENFLTADFVETEEELIQQFPPLKSFLLYRSTQGPFDNSSILPALFEFLKNDSLIGNQLHAQIAIITSLNFDLDQNHLDDLREVLKSIRTKANDFSDLFFNLLLELQQSEQYQVAPDGDLRVASLLEKGHSKEDVVDYYKLVTAIHQNELGNQEVLDAIQVFTLQHDGLSIINECVRRTIFGYFSRRIHGLSPSEYTDMMEVTKLYPVFMKIFENEQFNKLLKDLSMSYIKKLLAHFTDKRGRDYQDIKRFVSVNFVELGFINDKEAIELFKTKRKKD